MGILDLLKLVWGLASSKLGILVLAGLVLGAGGLYHKVTTWRSEVKIDKITKEKEAALRDLNQEKQKVADLKATIEFQRGQLSLRQRAQKETSDVKKAVAGHDLEYLRRNAQRLHDYKNPAATPANLRGNPKGPKPPAKIGPVH